MGQGEGPITAPSTLLRQEPIMRIGEDLLRGGRHLPELRVVQDLVLPLVRVRLEGDGPESLGQGPLPDILGAVGSEVAVADPRRVFRHQLSLLVEAEDEQGQRQPVEPPRHLRHRDVGKVVQLRRRVAARPRV